MVAHVAILVVYFLRDDADMGLLQLHCNRIARHTSVPYTIYATANRCSADARSVVSAQPNITMIDVADTHLRGSAEHGYYLDALLQAALNGPASHVCTLDVDSFPIVDDWVDIVGGHLDPVSGVAGVLRAENSDTALAHPSCIFGSREFFERYRPTFAPFPTASESLRAFLRDTGQRSDTGIDVVAQLWKAELGWGKLLRSNRNDPHYLMAGVYGNAIFHLGGIGRGKVFRRDLQLSRVHRVSRKLQVIPKWLGGNDKRILKMRAGVEARMANQNRNIYLLLREWLLADCDGMLAYLQGDTDGQPWVRRLEQLHAERQTLA